MVGFAKLINYMENKNSSSAKNWGGARDGSGRKRTTVKNYNFRATPEVNAILQEVPGSKTEFINKCILYYHENAK